MSAYTQINVTSALLPPLLLERLQSPEGRHPQTYEKEMTSVARLIVNLMKETVLTIERRNIRELDANPGDKGCQMRAVLLRELLISPDVSEELKGFKESIKLLVKIVHARRLLNGNLKVNDESTCQFFRKHILPIEVSVDILFLIYCKLLTITKVKHHTESNGIVVTHLQYGRLSILSNDIPIAEGVETHFREEMICDASIKLAQNSLTSIQNLAKKMCVSPLLLRMLIGVRQNKPAKGYKPKLFGCQFYEIQLVLTHLRKQTAYVAIKTVVVKGNPQLLFLKSPAPEEEFRFVEPKDVPQDELLVVFEGVLQQGLSIEEFSKKVELIGFSRLILVLAAQEEPYEHGSTLNDVTDVEGRAEIESYIKMAPEIGCIRDGNPLLLLDHIFCNSAKEELKTQGKSC
jgi:hypothetical protein